MIYCAKEDRYNKMSYKRCGESGLLLPRLALGLWHNFGSVDSFENQKELLFEAFDNGITHFDLANNYGPVYGSAEENFGKVISKELKQYRDELIISTKAGYDMWPGPYGNNGSRKYLVASLDQSLRRMQLDYVDIFYHHRPDDNTPLEETMNTLSDIVRQGKALYVGLSNYSAEQTKRASSILKANKTPCLIHQPSYNMMNRWIEESLQDVLMDEGIGSIVFCPLAQGLLTNKYLGGIPKDSRASREHFLKTKDITNELINKLEALNKIAENRSQSLAQMSIAWILRNDLVTTVLIGASKKAQILENIEALKNTSFSEEELKQIDTILALAP